VAPLVKKSPSDRLSKALGRGTRGKNDRDGSYWTATPGLQLDMPSMVRLEAQVGMMDPAARRGMMAADELEDLERLEQLGSLHDKLEEDWKQDQREQAFLMHSVHHVSYNPDRWTETLLACRGRARASFPCWIVIIEAFILAVIAEVNPELAEEFVISGQMHALVGGCVTFLIVFRTQYAFRKWWDGRTAFGQIVQISRTLGQQITVYVEDTALCDLMVRYVIAATVATRCHLRNTSIDQDMLAGVLTPAQVQQMNTYSNMPLFATMVVRRGLSQAIKEGSVAPVQVSMENTLGRLETAIGEAERMLTPMPFVYVSHLRSFLVLYLLALPFVLVIDLGRLMVVGVGLAAYLLIGLENTAVELENPYGVDANDLPLDLYCIEVSREMLALLDGRGDADAILPVRKASKETPLQRGMSAYGDGADDG